MKIEIVGKRSLGELLREMFDSELRWLLWRKEIDIMNSYKLDLEKYAALARQAVAEGCVLLLENEGQALPLRDGRGLLFLGVWRFIIIRVGLALVVW